MVDSRNKNPASLPQRNIFDPWNSSSTGHQVSDSSLSRSTGWRQTRTQKLAKQFRSSTGGDVKGGASGASVGPSGAGEWKWISEEDARKQELGCEDIRGFMGGERKRKVEGSGKDGGDRKRIGVVDDGKADSRPAKSFQAGVEDIPPPSSQATTPTVATAITNNTANGNRDNAGNATSASSSATIPSSTKATNSPGIFAGLTVYINGSTAPLISDHKLKHVLASNGASVAIALGRRSVTHVVLGTPSSQGGAGAGGGLAAGKMQKEIIKKRGGGGAGVRYVGVEWYVFCFRFARSTILLRGNWKNA